MVSCVLIAGTAHSAVPADAPSVAASSGAPTGQKDEPLDNSDYSYGEVVKASEQNLSVLEYDYEMDEERTVDYNVTPNTVLTNIAKAAQLAKGDTVEVYFKEETGGKRVAQMVIKDDTANPVEDQTPAP
jgi:hypothetical protein